MKFPPGERLNGKRKVVIANEMEGITGEAEKLCFKSKE